MLEPEPEHVPDFIPKPDSVDVAALVAADGDAQRHAHDGQLDLQNGIQVRKDLPRVPARRPARGSRMLPPRHVQGVVRGLVS